MAQKTTTIMFLAVEISQMIEEIVRCPVVFSFASAGPIWMSFIFCDDSKRFVNGQPDGVPGFPEAVLWDV